MENVIININFYVNRLRDYFVLIKERKRYLETYSTDYNHLKMKENFDIVLDNIVNLKNTFGLKHVSEITILIPYMIHYGCLSEKGRYKYKKSKDEIEEFCYEDLIYALKIFNGFGCCRNTTCFEKIALDKMGIVNEKVITYVEETNYILSQIRLFFNNFFKWESAGNHIINYIKDKDLEWLIDLTENEFGLYYANKQFCYPYFIAPNKREEFYPLYNYSTWQSNKHDYQNVKPLSLEEQEKISFSIEKTLVLFQKNNKLFKEFYFENLPYYKEINSAYQDIYEEEKRLGLIRK